MIWATLISAALGILCGAWMPILPFMAVALVGTLGVGLSSYMAGLPFDDSVKVVLAVWLSLQVGYAVGLFTRLVLIKVGHLRSKKIPGKLSNPLATSDEPRAR